MIQQPWSRPLPEVTKNGAAYFTIMNHGNEDDRIIGASTPVAERAELHSHIHKDGVMKMEKQDSVDVPVHGTVMFEPGGLHVMLLGLTQPMTKGTEYPLTLEFEKSGMVEVTVRVMDPPEGGMDHSGHSSDSGETMNHSTSE